MKKALLIFLIIFIGFNLTAQEEWSTDQKNDLSAYLSKNIPKKLLRKATFPSKKTTISAFFSINKNHEIYNFKTTNRNRELNTALRIAFENYPIKKFNIDHIDQSVQYNLYIISKKGSKNIFKCSNSFPTQTAPSFNNSKIYSQYPDRLKQFTNEVKEQFVCNFDFSLIPDKKVSYLQIPYKITKKGKLIHRNISKSNSKEYLNEIERVLKLIKKVTPVTFKNEPRQSVHNISISLVKEYTSETICLITSFGDPLQKNDYLNPLSRDANKKFQEYSQPTISNDLSLFFKENLSNETILKSNLNSLNNALKISFSIDKKNTLTNIKTTARSKIVSDELVRIFLLYPIDKLNLVEPHPLNTYYLQILSFENDITIINASTNILYERIPIITGCENSKNFDEGKKCFNTQIATHINKKFNTGIAKKLNLTPGKHRILSKFTISSSGAIKVTEVKASHPALKLEATRVISTIPKIKLTAVQNGKPVSIKYSLPISFLIAEPKSTYSTDNSYFNTSRRNF